MAIPTDTAAISVLKRLSHDLKNPIAVVLANLNFMIEKVKEADILEAARESEWSAKRIADSLDDLSALEELQIGTFNASPTVFGLSDMEWQLSTLLSPQLGSRHLLFKPCGDVRIRADRRLCYRVLANVLEHCIKNTVSGETITLSVSAAPNTVIRIEDTGPPFENERSSLFTANSLNDVRSPERNTVDPSARYRRDGGIGLFFAGQGARAMGAIPRTIRREPGPGVIFECAFKSADVAETVP